MHLKKVNLFPEKYPTTTHYPFSLTVFQKTGSVAFQSPVTFFQGENGSGKTTLLNLIGGLDTPTRGKIFLEGRNISMLNDNDLAEIRKAVKTTHSPT